MCAPQLAGEWLLGVAEVYSLVQWLVEVWRRRKEKLLMQKSRSNDFWQRQQKAYLQSHQQQLFQVSLRSSIHPSSFVDTSSSSAAFILFLLIIMICIQQKRLIQAGIRLPAQAGRWACVLGGFWVVWLLRTYNNKDYERLITEIWKTQIEVMWLLRLCLMTWPHVCVFAGSVCRVKSGARWLFFKGSAVCLCQLVHFGYLSGENEKKQEAAPSALR